MRRAYMVFGTILLVFGLLILWLAWSIPDIRLEIWTRAKPDATGRIDSRNLTNRSFVDEIWLTESDVHNVIVENLWRADLELIRFNDPNSIKINLIFLSVGAVVIAVAIFIVGVREMVEFR